MLALSSENFTFGYGFFEIRQRHIPLYYVQSSPRLESILQWSSASNSLVVARWIEMCLNKSSRPAIVSAYLLRPSNTCTLYFFCSNMPSSVEKTAAIQGSTHDGPNEIPLLQLASVATTVLRQGLDLVENVLTSDDQLKVHSKYLPGSTIGTPRRTHQLR